MANIKAVLFSAFPICVLLPDGCGADHQIGAPLAIGFQSANSLLLSRWNLFENGWIFFSNFVCSSKNSENWRFEHKIKIYLSYFLLKTSIFRSILICKRYSPLRVPRPITEMVEHGGPSTCLLLMCNRWPVIILSQHCPLIGSSLAHPPLIGH